MLCMLRRAVQERRNVHVSCNTLKTSKLVLFIFFFSFLFTFSLFFLNIFLFIYIWVCIGDPMRIIPAINTLNFLTASTATLGNE